MDLLERYLHAVGKYLPPATREDVLAELRVNLQAEMDERAEESESPLTENEAGWQGSDIDFVTQALRDVLAQYTVDKQRVVVQCHAENLEAAGLRLCRHPSEEGLELGLRKRV